MIYGIKTLTPIGVIAHESAYPGSMSEKADGTYIDRNDPVSLAAALLEMIAKLKRQRENLIDAMKLMAEDAEKLARRCAAHDDMGQEFYDWYDRVHINGQLIQSIMDDMRYER